MFNTWVAILILLIIFVSIYFFVGKKEHLTNVEFNKVKVNPKCTDMAFVKLLRIFNNDSDKMADYLVDNGVPLDVMGDYTKYDQIISYLIKQGKIDSSACN